MSPPRRSRRRFVEPTSANVAIRPANAIAANVETLSDGGHGTRNYPAALVGKAGGKLKTGRHLAYKERTPMANLYVEMLNLMDVPTEQFGDSHTAQTRAYDGRLPGLV